MASGVLPLMFGKTCKLAGAALTHDKAYEAEVCFGITTATDDVEGEVISRSDERPTREALLATLPHFMGVIQQVPPVYSALKVGGKAMYRHAREGAPVAAQPREVRVDVIELLDFDGERARLRIECGSGTYIRSIARDLGAALGCGAHLSGLRRTRVGQYRVQDAVTLDALLAEGPTAAQSHLHRLLALVAGWPQAALTDEQARRFAQGQAVPWQTPTNPNVDLSSPLPTGPAIDAPEGQVAVLHAGRLAGLARQVPQPDGSVRLAPLRVIVPD